MIQYIKKLCTIFAIYLFLWYCTRQFYSYSSGIYHWHWANPTIVKLPQRVWINKWQNPQGMILHPNQTKTISVFYVYILFRWKETDRPGTQTCFFVFILIPIIQAQQLYPQYMCKIVADKAIIFQDRANHTIKRFRVQAYNGPLTTTRHNNASTMTSGGVHCSCCFTWNILRHMWVRKLWFIPAGRYLLPKPKHYRNATPGVMASL